MLLLILKEGLYLSRNVSHFFWIHIQRKKFFINSRSEGFRFDFLIIFQSLLTCKGDLFEWSKFLDLVLFELKDFKTVIQLMFHNIANEGQLIMLLSFQVLSVLFNKFLIHVWTLDLFSSYVDAWMRGIFSSPEQSSFEISAPTIMSTWWCHFNKMDRTGWDLVG